MIRRKRGGRHGHVMLMTNQDSDGSHIKGLLMNFFRVFWPNFLLNVDQSTFLSCFIAPLQKETHIILHST